MRKTFEIEVGMELRKGGYKRGKYLVNTTDDTKAIEIAKSDFWKSLGKPDGLLYIVYCFEQRV